MLWSDERIANEISESRMSKGTFDSIFAAAIMARMRNEYEQRIAELEARLTTTSTGEGWIEWHGGSQPVDDDQPVEIKLRDGEVMIGVASDFAWWYNDECDDIVAYRVVGGE